MRIKKSWKIAATVITSVAVAATTLTILFLPQNKNAPMTTYLTKFSGDGNSVNRKNKYIDNLITDTSVIMNEYINANPKSEGLDFEFINLNANQTSGEINYFDSLNRSMRAINPNIGITNYHKTPASTQDGYYQRNAEMVSFFWSPDYNGVGTWLDYAFTDTYQVPNLWPMTYSVLESVNPKNPKTTEASREENKIKYPWAESLLKEIEGKGFYFSPIEILNNSLNGGMSVGSAYTSIPNTIGTWVSNNSGIETDLLENTSQQTKSDEEQKKVYKNPEIGIQFVDFLTSKNINIPIYEPGNGVSTPKLVRTGFYNTTNPETDYSMRDWYFTNQTDKNQANIWLSGDPFVSSSTPWNPSFSQAPNSLFAQSLWTPLTSWTTLGNENDKNNNKLSEAAVMVSNGITQDFNDKTDGGDYYKLREQFENRDESKKCSVKFNIRPIPWVNSSGQHVNSEPGKQAFLSPADYTASIKSFLRSTQNGVNSNNDYFKSLSSIDFDKTIEHEDNWKRNETITDDNVLEIFFDNPILPFDTIIDVLQKQYFTAVPAFHEKVQNIIDDKKYAEAATFVPNSNVFIDLQKQDWNKFYGCGIGQDVWKDLYFAAPYYIENVNEQKISYKLNESYFNSFNDVNKKIAYQNFNKEYQVDGNPEHTQRKIETIESRYAGSFNNAVTFNSFVNNELDSALVSGDYLNSALKNSALKNQLQYETVRKINKSNVASYNQQIYEKDGSIIRGIGPDGKEAPMVESTPDGMRVTYQIDEYGNYVWKEGWKPKLKSRVSQAYADLIAKDFYTPKEAGGKSEKIRHTINSSINWVSLKSIYSPGVTVSIQYSFMPFGVYPLDARWPEISGGSGSGSDDLPPIPLEYWEYSANKAYMLSDLDEWGEKYIDQRKTGLLIWTYDELLQAIVGSLK
ncbi:MAG: MG321/MPN456 family lipoprotein [Mycoplasma sp.]